MVWLLFVIHVFGIMFVLLTQIIDYTWIWCSWRGYHQECLLMSIGRDPLCEINGLVGKVLQIITIILIYCCAYILSMPNCCKLLCCHDISSWPRIEHYMKDLSGCTVVDVGLGFLIYMLAILYSLLCLFFYCFFFS